MGENKNKFNAFKPASLTDWEVAARQELNGADPWEKLVHQGNSWSIQPFYDRNAFLPGPPLLHASQNEFLGPRTWYNCPYLIADDAKKANEKALEYLQGGAEGIFFELKEKIDFEILLKDIEWQYCSLNFLAKKNQDAIVSNLHTYISEKRIAKEHIHGAFFGNIASKLSHGHFRFAGFQMNAYPSPVDEIVEGFMSMNSALKKDFQDQSNQIAFSIMVGTDFFLEVAKLRAIRVVWNKYLAETKSKINTPLFIHAHSMKWTDKNYQPHGNMLKSTTAAMAAILGGCDALTIDPEEVDHTMMIRVARNVSNILREESFFSKVADPVAGSYFIENLTQQLASAVWKSIEHKLTV